MATRVARRQEPLTPEDRRILEADFAELTAEAEELVAAETGLRSLAGPARARVADRPQWVRRQRGVLPATAAPCDRQARSAARPHPGLEPHAGGRPSRQVTGAQVGLVLGWMSTRVLGQYDQLLIEDEQPEDQDIVYYVGPNVVSVERRYGFPPREFRLWLALHEVTHRAQFTGVPWLRDHFLSLVGRTLEGIDPDPKQLLASRAPLLRGGPGRAPSA